MSRSALVRLLRRRGCSRLPAPAPAPEPQASESKPFKGYEPGYVHIDVKYLPQMADQTSRSYVFVAIDRATRWVFIAVKRRKTAAAAKAFLKALSAAAPFLIRTILTDSGKEFTDRLFDSPSRSESGQDEFNTLCQAPDIDHRFIKPRRPQTNGMFERFNGRLDQVLRSHRFDCAQDLRPPCAATSVSTTSTCRRRGSVTRLLCKPSNAGINHPLSC